MALDKCRARFGHARTLCDAVTDNVDGIVARHLLLLQQIGGVALTFRKDRHHTFAPVTSSRPEDWT
jgi:hypothetical protein